MASRIDIMFKIYAKIFALFLMTVVLIGAQYLYFHYHISLLLLLVLFLLLFKSLFIIYALILVSSLFRCG